MYKGISREQRAILAAVFLTVTVLVTAIWCTGAWAQAGEGKMPPASESPNAGWAYLAAALSVGLGCVGAGIAVAYVGSAAVGAVAEKPQLAARTLIFVGLAEGIAIYGLIIGIMVLGRV
ncbi:MAG TPA: ATP synthase subunit C [Candidatus Hydrogenedentes bacterium]|nr:ATP synthase subunit C [Candidatus Hydrogenedentota bacterium]HQE81543.1 ATP synthase subunit C [Candidatus Hydrogenedentota bacterium]HQH51862.1 ATP synthase subunit C [Candidatus Hydrogenedentota bacterium]HQM49993.1 ATP synthase subunit C [Candidatus Hydrogenedentota bacterium]